jgi:hypothetical protein
MTAALTNRSPILGTWKLVSYVREDLETGERYNQYGDKPDGYLGYASDGRMSAIITWDNRVKPQSAVLTNDERVALHGTMSAYAGTYTADAEKVVHHVDISWNQIWTDTDQVRFYELDGNILTITSALSPSPADGRLGRSVIVWEKVKGTPNLLGSKLPAEYALSEKETV